MRKGVSPLPIKPDEPTFLEGWRMGHYLVTGVFPVQFPATQITADFLDSKAEECFQEVRGQKKSILPRGIAVFYVIPIYLVEGWTEPETQRLFCLRQQYWKWSVWHDPVAVNVSTKEVWLREGFENPNFALRKHLLSVLFSGLLAIAKTRGLTGKFDLNEGTISLPIPEPRISR